MKILLATLHAKYSHASLALPCLASYCRDITDVEITLREWTINEPREHVLKRVIAEQADLVAFSCYIWNIDQTLRIASDIKKISPDTLILLGGPEVSFGIFDLMHCNPAIDFIIKNEGEIPFRNLITALLDEPAKLLGERLSDVENLFFRDGSDIESGPLSKEHLVLDCLPSPFRTGLVALSKPLVYYETSRGCPFSCAFCLSSVEGSVRSFGLERIKEDLLFLMDNKIMQIKLVDRTFNYDAERATAIWEFILEHNQGSHFHFEISADLLTERCLAVLARVPENTFRFEIGIQSAHHATLERVKRNADPQRTFAMVKRLRTETRVELHLDLIAGLPREDYQGFLESLQAVADLHPHHIQVEPLKLLKGTPMREIGEREGYSFSDSPPYTILRNPWLSFNEITRIETIGRLLDLFNSSGGFVSAFRELTGRRPLSALLHSMATNADPLTLSGFSSLRLYELFFSLVQCEDDTSLPLFADALFFDYCCHELPRQGKLPHFIAARHHLCAWPGTGDLAGRLQIPPGNRIKAFRYTFLRDYRTSRWEEHPAEISFVYASSAGGGLKISVI